MKIDLRINDIHFRLNEIIDNKKLISISAKKAGFILRKTHNIDKNFRLYFSKNCKISFFNNEYIIEPNLDTSSGRSLMFGTSCFFYYEHNNLVKMKAQIIKNMGATQYHTKNLKKIASEKIGEPEIQKRSQYSDLDKIIRWKDNEVLFLIEFNKSYKNVYVHHQLI